MNPEIQVPVSIRTKPQYVNFVVYQAQTCWVAHCVETNLPQTDLTLEKVIETARIITFDGDDPVIAYWADDNFPTDEAPSLAAMMTDAELIGEHAQSVMLNWSNRPSELWLFKARFWLLRDRI